MRHVQGIAGCLLLAGGWAVLVSTWLGRLSPTIDAFASFLPVVPVALLAAIMLRRRDRAVAERTRVAVALLAWGGMILSVSGS